MALESSFIHNRRKALEVLNAAKTTNADRTIPIRVDRSTVIYITQQQAENPKFIDRLRKRFGIEIEASR